MNKPIVAEHLARRLTKELPEIPEYSRIQINFIEKPVLKKNLITYLLILCTIGEAAELKREYFKAIIKP